MSPVWGRLVALAFAYLAFAAGQPSSTKETRCNHETNLALDDVGDTDSQKTWTDPVPGMNAFLGVPARLLDVGKRDCLANGSNYCFGNNVNYCPGCGNCCVDGDYCCGGGKVCCGSGCCSSDQTCSNGKCLSSVATQTVTSTVLQTVTHIATQRATVVIAEIEISTAVSTIDVTISSAETQTNVIWATATAVAKRAVTSLSKGGEPRQLMPTRGRLSRPPGGIALNPRQASQGEPPTVTNYVTQTTDTLSISSVTVTAYTTSTIVTTVYQTNTRVLHAQETIDITSTFTITSYPLSTLTITTTASLILPATPISTNPPSNPPSSSPPPPQNSQSLPTPTLAGIAAGTSILALIFAAFVILCVRRRRHWKQLRHPETPPPLDDHYSPDVMFRPRQPTLPPTLPHFAPSFPAHHAAQFQLPASKALGGGGGGDGGYLSSSEGSQNHHQGWPSAHRRDSSGFTTLVGTPSPTSAGGFAVLGGKEYQKNPLAVAEVQGSLGRECVEIDGNAVIPGVQQGALHSSSPSSGLGSPRSLGLSRSVGNEAAVEVSGEDVRRG